MLSYTGQLAGKRVSTYEGKERCQLQFVEQKEGGALGFLEIKVPEGMDSGKYRVGENVTVPVEFKLVRDKIYWSVTKEVAGIGATQKA